MAQQRLAERKSLQTRVIFLDEFGHDFLYFISANISLSGVFIQTTLPLKPQTEVLLKFSLYEGDEPIVVSAEVMRLVESHRGPGRKKQIIKGLGLKFLGLSDKDFDQIYHFISS